MSVSTSAIAGATAGRPLYTPEERARRDRSPWTVVQGVLAPLQLLARQRTQLRGQGLMCHFTPGALVILGAELHQFAPPCVQGREVCVGRQHRFQALRVEFSGSGTVPDQTQHLASAEGHSHQHARFQGMVAGVIQGAAQAAVRWRINQNRKNPH